MRVSSEIEAAHARTRLRGGELLLTLVGTVGESAVVPSELAGWNVARAVAVIPVREDVGAYWVKLALSAPNVREMIHGRLNTTVQATLNLKDVAQLPILMPHPAERENIASIIGALDDKIELNRRTNETLEAMARAIFKSWFVDFDPVRAKVSGEPPESICRRLGLAPDVLALFPDSFQDSELGEIPGGWGVLQAGFIADVGIGKTPPRKETEWFSENPDDMKWVSIRDLGLSGTFVRATRERLTHEAVSQFNIRLVPDYTVLLSFKLTIGRVAISDGPMTTNEAIAHFNLPPSPQVTTEYLYLYLQQFDYARLGSTSSIAEAVNSRMIRELPVVVPSRQLTEAFALVVRDFFGQQRELIRAVAALEETRDILLRELLSGNVKPPCNGASEVC